MGDTNKELILVIFEWFFMFKKLFSLFIFQPNIIVSDFLFEL